jgi:hypothetical protein
MQTTNNATHIRENCTHTMLTNCAVLHVHCTACLWQLINLPVTDANLPLAHQSSITAQLREASTHAHIHKPPTFLRAEGPGSSELPPLASPPLTGKHKHHPHAPTHQTYAYLRAQDRQLYVNCAPACLLPRSQQSSPVSSLSGSSRALQACRPSQNHSKTPSSAASQGPPKVELGDLICVPTASRILHSQ